MLFPSFPQVFPPYPTESFASYIGWATCCYPTIQQFWQTPFDSFASWSGVHLVTKHLGGIDKWANMSYPKLFKALETWPEEYKTFVANILDVNGKKLHQTAMHVNSLDM